MAADPPFLGRGWAFPPDFTPGGAEVATVAGAEDVQQSLTILFSTAQGERAMRERFGADLGRFVFAEVDQALLAAVRGAISDAVLAWETRIRLDSLTVTEAAAVPGLLEVALGYTLRGTNSRFNLVFPFYLREATGR